MNYEALFIIDICQLIMDINLNSISLYITKVSIFVIARNIFGF